ncbi:MAG: DsbE family thiol:disulfide interchange protein [Pseudomonadota bacterium]
MTEVDVENAKPTTEAAPAKRKIGFVIAPLIVFLALATMFGLSLTSGDPSRLPSALIGKPAPKIDFAPLEGLSHSAASSQTGGANTDGVMASKFANGRVSVVNFWASWCRPCVEEHPHLVALTGIADIDLYGINYKDQPSNARRFLGRYGNPFTAVGVDPLGRNAIEWGVYGMPETFVVDGEGRIVYKHVGPITAQSLKERVLPAITAAAAKNTDATPQS